MHDDRRARIQPDVRGYAKPVHVKQRQREQQNVVGAPRPGLEKALDGGSDLAVGEHRPLALAGGAGGIHDERRVVHVDRGKAVFRGPDFDLGERLSQDDPLDGGALAGLEGVEDLLLRRFGEYQARLRVGQDVGNLAATIGQIDGHHDRADLHQRQVGGDQFQAVAEVEGDAVATLEAQVEETGRHTTGGGKELSVGSGRLDCVAAREQHRRLVRRAPRARGQQVREIHAGLAVDRRR